MTLQFLTICSYNRARSVMAELLLRRALDAAGLPAGVQGAGFASEGEPPLAATSAALLQMNVDSVGYRSTRVTPSLIAAADLILVAERIHAVRIAEDDVDVFHRCFTFPEFVVAAERTGPRGRRSFAQWVAEVGAGRTHATFLDRSVPEIMDPAGASSIVFDATARMIDDLCKRLVALL